MSQSAVRPAGAGEPATRPGNEHHDDARPGPSSTSLLADHPGAGRSSLEDSPTTDDGRDRRIVHLDERRARRHVGVTPADPDGAAIQGQAARAPRAAHRIRWSDHRGTLRQASRRGLTAVLAFYRRVVRGEEGMATAEYAIATLAAVGFAGLLVLILKGNEVKGLLTAIIRQALGG
ncbi:DUF4244 domain-containing protein [Tersicoccus phoenicis]|uniref:DUF4244 domain-containing protein n=1 Tax=Tersicoccus phoenicis TaxID=554083 RepID=UPI0026B2AEE2